MSSANSPARDLPPASLRWAVAALSLGLGLSVLDGFILNVALPAIAQEFAVTPDKAMTVVKAYQFSLTLALLPLAALGDAIGYRRIFVAGLILIILTSIWCATTNSLNTLIVARFFQGVGISAVMAVASALVRNIYPAHLLGRGLSFNAMVVAASSAAGPALAGAMLSVADWRWLFSIGAIIGLAALLLAWRWLPTNRHQRQPFDISSAFLSMITLGAVLLLTGQKSISSSHLLTAGLVVTGVVFGFLFVRRQLTLAAPMMPIDIMVKPAIALSLVAAVCTFCAEMLTFVSLPFFLSQTLDHSIATTGLIFTAWPLAIMTMALVTGRLADQVPAGLLGGIGLAVGCTGLVLLSLATPESSPLNIALRMALCGAGFVLFQVPNTRFVVANAPIHRAGSVGGMMGTVRLTGQTMGASLAALLLGLPQGSPGGNLLVAAGVAAAAACVSLLRLRCR